MNRHLLALCVSLSACSTDVPLELRPQGPPSPPDGAAPASPLAVSAWSIADLPDTHIEQVEWTPEGDVVVSMIAYEQSGDDALVTTGSLHRFAADGAPRWVSQLPPHDEGGGTYTAFDRAPGGGVRAAVSFPPPWPPTDAPPRPAELLWFDGDGAVTSTIALTGSSSGGEGDVLLVTGVVSLPDGGVAVAGVTGGATSTAVIARLDASGAPVWSVPIEWWAHGTQPEDANWKGSAANDLTLTPDGALVVRGHYFGDVTVGGHSASGPSGRRGWGVYIARIELDGAVSWSQRIDDGSSMFGGYTCGMVVARDGHVIVAGMVHERARVGDLELEVEGNNRHYAAELGADGQPLGLVELAYPEGIEWGFVGQALSMRGDQLILAGQDGYLGPERIFGSRLLTVAYDRDGAVQSTLDAAVEGEPASADGYTYDVAVSDEGRLVLGGVYSAWADFGQGPVVTAETGDEYTPYGPSGFVVVLDPPIPVD